MRAVESLLAELRGVFANRLRALLAFGPHASALGEAGLDLPPRRHARSNGLVHTLAVVDAVRFADLEACASLNTGWARRGLAAPLILGASELAHSLDVFPLEFSEIVATRRLISGTDPFESLAPKTEDVRRACEVQVKSHLLHLREGYIEAAGRLGPIAELVAAFVAPFKALLVNMARLEGGSSATSSDVAAYARQLELPATVVERLLTSHRPDEIKRSDAVRLYTDYLDAAERLARYVDQWAW